MAGAWEFAYDVSGGNLPPAIDSFPVAAAQTLKVGDMVQLSGQQVIKGNNGFGRCLGVMAQDAASLTAGTKVRVYVSRPGQVWKGKASADASTHVLNGTRTYDLNASQQFNVADTTGGSLAAIKLGDTVTDVYVIATAHELA